MSIPSFTPGYPPDGFSLGQTRDVIRNNLDGTFRAFSVDHQDQNEDNAGYHADIHLVPQATIHPSVGIPAAIPGFGQFFGVRYKPDNPGLAEDVELAYLSGLGQLSQLTGRALTQEGWGWTGGFLVQWGRHLTVSSGATIINFGNRGIPNFGINFPNACFGVVTSSGRLVASITASSFVLGGGTIGETVCWIAIGY